MLRIVQNSAPAGAKSYYSTADYYTEGQELAGVWRGKAAERLGLTGTIDKPDWDALCDNRDPSTGLTLTARQKSNRRVGYDFNFHVPKSVSLLYALTRDERIVDAFRDSVDATMRDIETEMKTRVRASGKDEDRITGNMVWGEFIHFTSRPVDGVPDPHLHAHCFVFNTTWDEKEDRWKAGQFADLKRDGAYFEAKFHSRLSRRMTELGLPVERTRSGWEIGGIDKSTLRKFSRRTSLIEAKAKAEGITDPETLDELGAKTRERKREGLTAGELKSEWESRLLADERIRLDGVAARLGAGPAVNGLPPERAVELAVEHCFERHSVLPERKVLTEALKRAYGAAGPEAVHRAFDAEGLITAERDGQRMATTRPVLAEERAMIAFAREARGSCPRLGNGSHVFHRDWLNAGQRRAVQHVLDSPDRVIVIRGAAGTGKTAMMQEAVEAIEENGKRVFTFAPSADASRGVLREEGFASADTVARLLLDEQLQAEIHGNVIWIDEAGLLGTRTMADLFDLADRLEARVILSGDRKQHGSVERGAALRLLEAEAGVVPAEIRGIQRQKGDYKQAVEALSQGRTEAGFEQLDRLGWICEVNDTDRYRKLAENYTSTVESGKSCLVVSPTHLEGEWITDEIRGRLKQSGRLAGKERQFGTLENTHMTLGEREDRASYAPGDVLVFHQNGRGFTRGQRVGVGETGLPLDQAERFQVFRRSMLPLAAGDLVRITRNGTTLDGQHRLNNGAVFTVKSFDEGGNIVLGNGWVVSKDYGHLAHGYVVTSHASQGKTVDCVLIGQSSRSFPASSREQFYVSVSRGRERAVVYTGDKAELREAVKQSDSRLSATELVCGRERGERSALLARLDALSGCDLDAERGRDREELSYER